MAIAFRKTSGADKVKVSCVDTIEIGDYVYIGSNAVADLADASNKDKMPCVGYVTEKENDTLAIITQFFLETDLSDVENIIYYISDEVAGSIQDEQPTGNNKVSQVVAQGMGSSSLLISIDPSAAVFNN